MSKTKLAKDLISQLKLLPSTAQLIVEKYPHELIQDRLKTQYSALRAGVRYVDIETYTLNLLEATARLQTVKIQEPEPPPLPKVTKPIKPPRPPILKAPPEVAARHMAKIREFLNGQN